MARGTDAWSRAVVVLFVFGGGIESGVLLADDIALRELDEALSIAERSGDDLALGSMWETMGVVLMHRDSPAERARGLALLGQVRGLFNGKYMYNELWAVEVYTARERATRGDRDGALPLMRAAVEKAFRAGQFPHCDAFTGALVETLLDGGADGDVAEAEGRDHQVGGRASRRRPGDPRNLADEAARFVGTSPWRRHRLSRLPRPLSRDGENAWLRSTYRVGRGDAMTAVVLHP